MQWPEQDGGNLYSYNANDFTFPSNIKQIGCIDDQIKIYMEDYVYTYLYQYAKTSGNKEKLAALIGKHLFVDGQEVVVINGAIQGKHSQKEKGIEVFSSETWEYVNEQIEVYFQGSSLVGWVHTQPGYGAFLMSNDETFHKQYFHEPWQVLYVLDPLERLDMFYGYNPTKTCLTPRKGFFIYYDKNKEMQEYMLYDSVSKPKNLPNESDEPFADIPDGSAKPSSERSARPNSYRMDAAKKIRSVLKEKIQQKEKKEKQYKNTLLAGVSSVLCVVCLLLGASLMSNIDRVSKLENEMLSIRTGYSRLAKQVEQTATTQVYAASPSEAIKQTPPSSSQPIIEAQAAESGVPKPITSAFQSPEEKQTPEVPKETQPLAETKDAPTYYIVEQGDNLGYISLKFYNTKDMVPAIMAANGMDDPDLIYYGKQLIMPPAAN